jgi:CRP/FNR family transcriptional regulator, cyclic AMP receptor protein
VELFKRPGTRADKPGRPRYPLGAARHRTRASVVVAHAIPDYVLAGQRERLLAMVDILESVPPEEIQVIARRSAFTRLEVRDAVLITPEEHEERLLLLLEGRARVCEEGPAGREMTVSVVEGGTLVGATGFASCRPWGLRVEALEPSIVCGVRRRTFEELVDRYPTVGVRVACLLGERLIETQDRLADLARKEVPERLASQILRLVEGEGLVTPEGYKIPTRYTHQQLATMIGANREAVTRAFGKLRCRGGVELRNRRIFVTDLETLKRTAQG